MARPKGYKHTSEELAKMRGRKHSPEELEKMSKWQKGRPKSEETKQKLRDAAIKRYSTPEVRGKISKTIKSKYASDPEYKERVKAAAIERCKNPEYLHKRSEIAKLQWSERDRDEWSRYQKELFADPIHKEKVRLARNAPDVVARVVDATKTRWRNPDYKAEVGDKISKAISGEKSPAWRGGLSFLPYCHKFNKALKEEIRELFERKCFICDKSEIDNLNRLNIHHVDYDKMQGCNGKDWVLVPLCNSCHSKTGRNREYWNEYLCIKLHARAFEMILCLT